ncbi:unnamed protein product [Bemisia tabaci]|uniref:SANT and BTB domain-containing protein n=1 Tax=Bemisia tabaci TaxID=7038 RepID=A0A9P0F496_BEMTA|nr:unnamed protein product [Bemisia tabaci]
MKLNEIINEGILDSILPYMMPTKQTITVNPPLIKKSLVAESRKQDKLSSQHNITVALRDSKSNSGRKKLIPDGTRNSLKGDFEVEIHVCDEIKNMKKDFYCPQKLLISKMVYFAEVTTGQKLEDMDISVHCDINIFDWLMKWVKKDCPPYEAPSKLDSGNVIPILVSASFLQMDPLLNDCLEYVHSNINAIVKMNINLLCLNDSIISRLCDYFSNTDVENIKDKKDKIQPRLFCKLILSLGEVEPDEKKNHYATIATLFRCGRCCKLISRSNASQILCKPQFMKLTTMGKIVNMHTREQGWTLGDHIRGLYNDLKTWRRVYWRLWAECHHLFCLTCNNFFPISQMDWCSYHPDSPQFFMMEQQRAMTFPIGRYPCCGEKAYRFEPLKNPICCQYKAHTPSIETDQEKRIYKILEGYKNVILVDPPQVAFPEKLIRLVKSPRADNSDNPVENCSAANDTFWWKGFEFTPALPSTKKSFLSRLWEKFKEDEKQRKKEPQSGENGSKAKKTQSDVTSTSESGEMSSPSSLTSDSEYDFDESSVGDGEDVSEEKVCQPVRHPSVKVRLLHLQSSHKIESHFQWKPHLPMRKNQDNQREYEEHAFKAMSQILMRKTCQLSEHQLHSRRSNYSINNGSHARMEQELRECLTSWTPDPPIPERKSFLYPAASSIPESASSQSCSSSVSSNLGSY